MPLVRNWFQRATTITFMLAGVGAYVTLYPPTSRVVKAILITVCVALALATAVASQRAEAAAEKRAQIQFDRLHATLRDTVPMDQTLKHRAIRAVQGIAAFLRERSAYEKNVIEPEIFRVSAEAVETKNSERFLKLAFDVKAYYEETVYLYHQRWGRTVSGLLEELYAAGAVTREEVAAAKLADHVELWPRVVVVMARAAEALPA